MRVLAPLVSDTLIAEFQLSSLTKAIVTSDSVSLMVSMFYDSGLPATAESNTWLQLTNLASGVDDTPRAAATELGNNYPNPFNPQTQIKFNLAEAGPVKLIVHDVAGRKVAGICDEQLIAGIHIRSWNGRHDNGTEAASGVYFIRLETKNGEWTQKAVLVR